MSILKNRNNNLKKKRSKLQKKSLKFIDQIEKIRSRNNVNWMDILRLAFALDPKSTTKIMKKINYDDKKISNLLNKISKSTK